MSDENGLYDVIEVQIAEPHTVRVLATGKTADAADAFIYIAIARRGVETCFYRTCEPNEYKDGDVLRPAPPEETEDDG